MYVFAGVSASIGTIFLAIYMCDSTCIPYRPHKFGSISVYLRAPYMKTNVYFPSVSRLPLEGSA